MKPDGEPRRIAMFKDNKLRLLMSLAGFERLGLDDVLGAIWIIPSSFSSQQLKEKAEMVEKHELSPQTQYGDDENPIAPQDLLRRKTQYSTRAEYDDDSGDDGIDDNDEEDFLFPAGGPTIHKAQALNNLKKRRQRESKIVDGEPALDEETREARRKAREYANLEKRRKIKSDLFVHDSDEDDDEERDRDFFAQEEKRRKGQSMRVLEALRSGKVESGDETEVVTGKDRKRKIAGDIVARAKRRKGSALAEDQDDIPIISGGSSSPTHTSTLENSGAEATDTPLSSPHIHEADEYESESEKGAGEAMKRPFMKAAANNTKMRDAGSDDLEEVARIQETTPSRFQAGFIIDSDSEDAEPVAKPARSRARAGFIIDSDSE